MAIASINEHDTSFSQSGFVMKESKQFHTIIVRWKSWNRIKAEHFRMWISLREISKWSKVIHFQKGFTVIKDVREIWPQARGHRALALSSKSTLIPNCTEILIWDWESHIIFSLSVRIICKAHCTNIFKIYIYLEGSTV